MKRPSVDELLDASLPFLSFTGQAKTKQLLNKNGQSKRSFRKQKMCSAQSFGF
jgi:hypothetical protein